MPSFVLLLEAASDVEILNSILFFFWGSEKLSNSSKVAQLGIAEVGFEPGTGVSSPASQSCTRAGRWESWPQDTGKGLGRGEERRGGSRAHLPWIPGRGRRVRAEALPEATLGR